MCCATAKLRRLERLQKTLHILVTALTVAVFPRRLLVKETLK